MEGALWPIDEVASKMSRYVVMNKGMPGYQVGKWNGEEFWMIDRW
jgi:hypothetical protein